MGPPPPEKNGPKVTVTVLQVSAVIAEEESVTSRVGMPQEVREGGGGGDGGGGGKF